MRIILRATEVAFLVEAAEAPSTPCGESRRVAGGHAAQELSLLFFVGEPNDAKCQART